MTRAVSILDEGANSFFDFWAEGGEEKDTCHLTTAVKADTRTKCWLVVSNNSKIISFLLTSLVSKNPSISTNLQVIKAIFASLLITISLIVSQNGELTA